MLICSYSVPYKIEPGEPVPAAIKRIVREQIESAARELSGRGDPDRDEAIHEARKSIKKIRGVLRLMQPELGETFRPENVRFRNLGRQLSQFRDGQAMIEVFDDLREKYRDLVGRRTLPSVRRGLIARKQQAEEHADIGAAFTPIAVALGRSARRVARWPLEKDGFAAIAPGLQATFRRGRKAMERARQSGSAQDFHDWRKRVKEHWYHVRLLESFWDGHMEAYEKSLKDLETALGEDHNLVLLEEKALPGNARDVDLCRELMKKYRDKLQAEALKSGNHIYGEKPGELIKRLKRLWGAKQPASPARARRSGAGEG